MLAVLGGMALAQQDKYSFEGARGLAFSEFRGYEGWQVVATSQNDKLVAGDPRQSRDDRLPTYRHPPATARLSPTAPRWRRSIRNPKRNSKFFPWRRAVPGAQHDVDFMVKDSKRFVG